MEQEIFWIDLFCGAGGVSLGIQKAGQSVIACINHDKNAILSHQANHPSVLHFTEDIRTIELSPIIEAVRAVKKANPNAKICLWASLECTHFSKAKGGDSRDKDSRTLAEHLLRYLQVIDFDYIYIENVEEFMSWGDLVAKEIWIDTEFGKQKVCPIKYDKSKKKMHPTWIPESKTKGKHYLAWIKSICKLGYHHQHKILNCADFGDPTCRKRYFGIFAKNGLKIKFPNPTHTDPKKQAKAATSDLFGSNGLKTWIPVKECLDLQRVGKSIFDRKKPLVERSLRRIYAGLVKYLMANDKQLEESIADFVGNISKEFSTQEQLYLPICKEKGNMQPFLSKYNSNSPKTGISVPQSINKPSSTICTHGRLAIVQPFLMSYYSSKSLEADKSKVNSIESPAPSVTTIPHESIVFLAKYYGNADQSSNSSPLTSPSPTVTTVDRFGLITCEQFLINPQFDNGGSSIENPCFTIIARMDKMPPYLVSGQTMQAPNHLLSCIVLKANDCGYTLKIKVAMALFGIADIKMRMLDISELKQIQSFPKHYTLIGTQAEQKKFIGNAVPSNTVKNLVNCLNL